jgi:hypothetical protein
VVVHPDHDEARLRRHLGQGRERIRAHLAQHRLIDDDDGRRQPLEQPDHVREIGGRGKRLDSGLALEQVPERRAHSIVSRGDEDRDRGCISCGCELRDHLPKHRQREPGRHRGPGLNRWP